MRYEPPSSEKAVQVAGQSYTDQRMLGKALIKQYGIRSANDLVSCSTCHR
jgi:cytochrome c peroxidase